jgi:hypothetical protein
MTYSDIIRFTSGLLQFAVACYALRLGRMLNTARVGWMLFSALTLLAVTYVLLPVNPFRSSVQLAVKADVVYALISLLLLIAMAHLDRKLKTPPSPSPIDQLADGEATAALQQQIAELTTANEEFQRTTVRLQAELAAARRASQELARTLPQEPEPGITQRIEQDLAEARQGLEIRDADLARAQEEVTELSRINQELRATVGTLRIEIADQQRAREQLVEQADNALQQQLRAHREELDAAAETARAAFKLTFASHLKALEDRISGAAREIGRLPRSHAAKLIRVSKLARAQTDEMRRILRRQPRGLQLPDAVSGLAADLSADQLRLQHQIARLGAAFNNIQKSLLPPPIEPVAISVVIPETATGVQSDDNEIPAVDPALNPALLVQPPEETAVSSIPTEPSAPADFQEHLLANLTETGTEQSVETEVSAVEAAPEADPEPAAPLESSGLPASAPIPFDPRRLG